MAQEFNQLLERGLNNYLTEDDDLHLWQAAFYQYQPDLLNRMRNKSFYLARLYGKMNTYDVLKRFYADEVIRFELNADMVLDWQIVRNRIYIGKMSEIFDKKSIVLGVAKPDKFSDYSAVVIIKIENKTSEIRNYFWKRTENNIWIENLELFNTKKILNDISM